MLALVDDAHLLPSIERRNVTVASFLAILLKVLSSPALIAGLIAFLQKTIHP